MTTKDTGGAAFPTDPNTQPGVSQHHHGMTLRDYFAGQALQNTIQCSGSAPDRDLTKWFGNRQQITRFEIMAAQAYEMADAMLAERSK